MGSCCGRCLPNSNRPNTGFHTIHLLPHHQSSGGIDFTYLSEHSCEAGGLRRDLFSRLFSRRKNKNQVLEMLNPQMSSYSKLSESGNESVRFCDSRDISLQCLDARALLAQTTTSTPASSLDLEWEHETISPALVHEASNSLWVSLTDEVDKSEQAIPTQEGDSEWSRVSSTNSLEWDNVQQPLASSPPASDLDNDTQLLLCEIERLTSQTLSETGLDLYS